jgi:hypothetical protein
MPYAIRISSHLTSKRLYAVPFMAYKRLLDFAALRRPVSTLYIRGLYFLEWDLSKVELFLGPTSAHSLRSMVFRQGCFLR